MTSGSREELKADLSCRICGEPRPAHAPQQHMATVLRVFAVGKISEDVANEQLDAIAAEIIRRTELRRSSRGEVSAPDEQVLAKVAHAMFASEGRDVWHLVPDHTRHIWLRRARVAVAALRSQGGEEFHE